MKKGWLLLAGLLASQFCNAQGFPWERPLKMTWSGDGITFNVPTIFQDSAGVPSVVRWRGDTLIAAFQWFRQPDPSPTWDRVAVKFSYDNGQNWTVPAPIVINGLPPNYQRPFDPTLVQLGGDSLRIYFSSSAGMPPPLLDSTVNTYSAVSTDGINYQFEPGARVDVVDNRVIDPAVIEFGPGWHYLSPAGAPQDGAYHYVTPDGLNFFPVAMITSDAQHNWTGNYMVNSFTELRFYGAGQNGIWYNASPNGGVWTGYVNTNILGGDPSVVKVATNSYLMVYVGQPYNVGLAEHQHASSGMSIVPVPAHDLIRIHGNKNVDRYRVLSVTGALIQEGRPNNGAIHVDRLPAGTYLLELTDGTEERTLLRFVKE
ncbi:MAG: T9SS type A sorting domain-containing protein [Flavobacteriales bacterium]|nr:T9SS type A sorting domain-containing protein [Flavobacteriales bacterium]